MSAIQVNGIGDLNEVVKLIQLQDSNYTADQVLVEFIASPINPSDILMIKGLYPSRATFPRIFGNEGIGKVIAKGDNVTTVELGDVVLLPLGSGTWRSKMVVNAKGLFALPHADPLQLAMVSINPPTALLLIKEFVDLQPGDWLIQNAANSAVGQYIIRLAKLMGYKTINIVRRDSLIAELTAIGADIVVVDDADLISNVKTAIAGDQIKLALDAVSGEASDRLLRCLGNKGTLVVYGAMSLDLIKLNMAMLMAKDITVRSFWLSHWFRETDRKTIQETYSHLISLITKNQLKTTIDSVYPLEEFNKALAHADQPSKTGKILFSSIKL